MKKLGLMNYKILKERNKFICIRVKERLTYLEIWSFLSQENDDGLQPPVPCCQGKNVQIHHFQPIQYSQERPFATHD